jgi:hypothetical protein
MNEQPSELSPPQPPREEHWKARSTWVRLFFMVVIAIFYGVSRLIMTIVVVVQFLHVLFTGQTNPKLRDLGQSLAIYTYQIVRYLCFNSEERPFPFDAPWPSPTQEL